MNQNTIRLIKLHHIADLILTAEQFPYKSILNMLADPNASYITIGNATIARGIVLLLQNNFLRNNSCLSYTKSDTGKLSQQY